MNTVDTNLKLENIETACHLLQGFVLMTVSTSRGDTPLLIYRHANTTVTTHDYTVLRLPKLNTYNKFHLPGHETDYHIHSHNFTCCFGCRTPCFIPLGQRMAENIWGYEITM